MLAGAAVADVCRNSSAPACPSTGVKILDDTYPVQTFVISQAGTTPSPRGRTLPRATMLEVMRAYNFNPASVPNIVYPASRADFEQLRPLLIQDIVRSGKTTEEATRLVDERVRLAEAPTWTWQQDYFEATFDPATGQPRINYSEIYGQRDIEEGAGTRDAFNAIAAAGVCSLTAGPELKSSYLPMFTAGNKEAVTREMGTTPTESAEFGGNMEGLPGGLCLVGDNMTDAFAEQICGSRDNMVKIEANWLSVGHVDEIMKVLPDRRSVPGRPPECAFTIMSADTELGLSLLAEPGALNQSVLQLDLDPEFKNATSPGGLAYNDIYRGSFQATPSTKILCRIVNEEGRNNPAAPAGKSGTVIEAFVRFLVPEASAQGRTRTTPTAEQVQTAASDKQSAADLKAYNCINNYDEVKNSEFVAHIRRNEGLVAYNRAIQEAMVRSRQKIYDKILAKLPQCRPFFSSVDQMFTKVPNYFSPAEPDEAGTHVKNGRIGYGASAISFFPNPTNSLIMNNTVIFPSPVPAAYSDYLNRSTRALGLTPSQVDTWDYAHTGQGNIHCSSHSIPYCRPAGAR